ncbi:putative Dehydrogenase/reductase SDR family member 11 [Hypsibius exemplaris]|uniref:Dehydrogenase/reductase SDR family member 11 n=1 Tax=Hypsibius exemplaris TaxID=2072580 RepID=A0A9X6RJJ1_HYPEX|nr:putative Dehydrogenase/reductase SDR family member 11 [Hypsibius exemplaris]
MFELNILAITISTTETLRLLEKDGIETGHIVNINSMAGHSVPAMNYGTNFYTGTKHMLKALTTALSTELAAKKSKIRVTSLSPGLTDTPLIEGARKDSERGHFFKRAALQGKDVADAVLYVLGTPSHVVITELTIVPAVV